jgi:hypothetical protein
LSGDPAEARNTPRAYFESRRTTVKNILNGLVLAALVATPAHAAITVPGANGSDGPLNITTTTAIDLSQAPTGVWDSNSPTPGKGIYDPEKWAVVFHYSSVNIAAGATVTFTSNASRAPVVWLVNGDVTILGAVSVSGNSFTPGPGGFRGAGNGGAGHGPGGGVTTGFPNGASYATPAPSATGPYGNSAIVPLIGGSGSGAYDNDFQGGPGGGAILIAATGTITVQGAVTANGGQLFGSVGGSGGAIRLVADGIVGGGTMSANPGNVVASAGRIRIEIRTTVDPGLSVNPLPSTGRPATPALLWPTAAAASVRIVSVGSEPWPSDPKGQFNAAADVLPDILSTSLPVIIETKNVPTSAVVNLRVVPPTGNATLLPATFQSGNADTALWKVMITPRSGNTALQVRVEVPSQ